MVVFSELRVELGVKIELVQVADAVDQYFVFSLAGAKHAAEGGNAGAGGDPPSGLIRSEKGAIGCGGVDGIAYR